MKSTNAHDGFMENAITIKRKIIVESKISGDELQRLFVEKRNGTISILRKIAWFV